MNLGNAEHRQRLRNGVRVRLQGRHGISGRERVEFTLADRLKNVLEFRRRDFFKSVRKRACKYGNILRVRSERLAEVVVISISRLIDLVGSDQIICIFVFVEKFERTCQINAGHIVLPRVGVMVIEVIAQIKDVIGGDNAFTREHVNPIGQRSCFG